jgi:mono/diheme cytochrome c family protein
MQDFTEMQPVFARRVPRINRGAAVKGSRSRRGSWLIAVIGLATLAVACGRATEDDINAALGITPTPTMSAEQAATATAEADANATQAAAVASGASPADAAADDTDLAALGNVMLGRTGFAVQCQRCHNPAGTGVGDALSGENNPADALSDVELYSLIAEGTNHGPDVGGPGALTTLTDKQIYDLIAFIRSQ